VTVNIDAPFAPIPLFLEQASFLPVVLIPILVVALFSWYANNLYGRLFYMFVMLVTVMDIVSRWRFRLAQFVPPVDITQEQMIQRVSTSAYKAVDMEFWFVLKHIYSAFSLLPPFLDTLEAYVVPTRRSLTTDIDVRLLSNKNARRDDDARYIFEVVIQRRHSSCRAYVSKDVLDQLGTRAEHFDDKALKASSLGICGGVAAVNIHSSVAWHVYQDTAMVGSMIITQNKRLRRDELTGESKNVKWVTPQLLQRLVIALVTSPFLIYLIRLIALRYGNIPMGLIIGPLFNTLSDRLSTDMPLLCQTLTILARLFVEVFIVSRELIQSLILSFYNV